MFVWQRDDSECVSSGSNEDLEFDHIIPVSRGGSNTRETFTVPHAERSRDASRMSRNGHDGP
jgi:5-methylcytosine-specific restriction endonuclease McrA